MSHSPEWMPTLSVPAHAEAAAADANLNGTSWHERAEGACSSATAAAGGHAPVSVPGPAGETRDLPRRVAPAGPGLEWRVRRRVKGGRVPLGCHKSAFSK